MIHFSKFARRRRRLASVVAVALALGGVGLIVPTAANAAGGTEIATTTHIDLLSAPTKYGDQLVVTATVKVQGPVDLSQQPVTFEMDGHVIGTSVLVYSGTDRFTALPSLVYRPSAGEHTVVARFSGFTDDRTTGSTALPSVSDPVVINIAQAHTTTTITNAPSTVRAHEPVNITAHVESNPKGVSGDVVLRADGVSIATAQRNAAGDVLFNGVVIPEGTANIDVAFLGATSYVPSVSPAQPIKVILIDTMTDLTLSSSNVRADETVTLTAMVTTALLGVNTDPQGAVEFIVDGTVYATVPINTDPVAGDGTARFEVDLTDMAFGISDVVARFVPAPGFVASVSDAETLFIRGITTELSISSSKVSGTDIDPPSVDVSVLVPADATRVPVDGIVRAVVIGGVTGDRCHRPGQGHTDLCRSAGGHA